MSKVNTKAQAIIALIVAGNTDKEIMAETKATKGTVKAVRMQYDAEQAAAAKIVVPAVEETNELAAMMAANTPEATTPAAPAEPKAKRAPKVVKDLTKRDVVAIVSEAQKIVYICTSAKYSGVGVERANTLLTKDLVARANQHPKNEQGIRDLLAADDVKCVLTLTQGELTEAQVNKLKTHIDYEAKGFLMLSTKGRGAEVKALLAQIAAEAAPAAETVGEGETVAA